MSTPSTIRVDNDLASCESSITLGNDSRDIRIVGKAYGKAVCGKNVLEIYSGIWSGWQTNLVSRPFTEF